MPGLIFTSKNFEKIEKIEKNQKKFMKNSKKKIFPHQIKNPYIHMGIILF